MVELADGLLLRAGDQALRIDSEHAGVARQVLALLGGDPEATLPRLLTDSLGLIAALETAGLAVVNGADAERWEEPPVITFDTNTSGAAERRIASVQVVGNGVVATAVAAELERDGITTAVGSGERADVVVVAHDGPDLEGMEAEAARVAVGQRWLPAFLLGDQAIVGPVLVAGRPPCVRCLQLRWMGMAVSVTSERAYLSTLRSGGWRIDARAASAVGQWIGRQAAVMARAALHAARSERSPVGRSVEGGRWSAVDVVVAHLKDGTSALRRLVAHPACPVCGPGFTEPDRDDVVTAWETWATPLASASEPSAVSVLDGLQPLVDDRFGVVSAPMLDSSRREIAAHDLVTALARFAVPNPLAAGRDLENVTHGGAPEAELASAVAAIEGIERYCGLSLPKPVVLASFVDVAAIAVDPAELPLYSPAQYELPGFPHPPFDPEQPLPWTWAWSLVDDRPKLVPQAAVRYAGSRRDIVDETSSGVAAHSSRPAALLAALLEVIERDAFMIFWLHRLAPPLLDPDGWAPFVSEAAARIDGLGYHPVLADLSTDLGVPVVLALAWRDDAAMPALRIGAGCALHPTDAVDKAMRELYGAIVGTLDVPWALGDERSPDTVGRLDDHVSAYSHPAWLSRASFLWSSTHRQLVTAMPSLVAGDDTASRLGALVGCLARHDFDVLAADLTTPEVAGRLHVVRGIVPGLQPIGFGRHGLRLGGRRLYETPARMGYGRGPVAESALNPDPHPFP